MIIGQGLAGSLLAWRLHQLGHDVLVVDDGHRTSSTRAAAGLFNPVTGRRLVKTEDADRLIPAALKTYGELSRRLGRRFFFEKALLRLVRTEQEWIAWEKRKNDQAYDAYLGERIKPGQLNPLLADSLGGFRQLQTGRLDTAGLLAALRGYFLAQGRLIDAAVRWLDIDVDGSAACWNGISAKRIIFCEGYKAKDNPWFAWLPFQPAKGEILTLQTAAPLPAEIITAGKWLMPLDEGMFKLGATYEWRSLDESPTEKARCDLLGNLDRLLKAPPSCELIDHQAGVRPGTRDKQPFLGLHPQYPQLGIFNGFGSKGSLMIPWYASRLAAHLLEDAPLPARADIRRHFAQRD